MAAQLFLMQFLPLLQEGKVIFAPRSRKNREFLLEHGLREEDVLEFCSQLKSEHYQWGPDADHDGTQGGIWLFFLPSADLGLTLYIKLKLWTTPENKGAIISFHEEGTHDD